MKSTINEMAQDERWIKLILTSTFKQSLEEIDLKQ